MLKADIDLFIEVTCHSQQFAQVLNVLPWAQANLTIQATGWAFGTYYKVFYTCLSLLDLLFL